ncbi:MAG TPA: HAD-IIIA family hydrolase [Phycisphaerales bacterium]|nr:HAD-IIIA family hydrolase [Phycisphaerales bacterium]
MTIKTDIELIAMDVDGVLTDGGIVFDDNGLETKRFSVLDGFAIKLAQKLGIHVAIITGRTSGVVTRRAADLEIGHLIQGSKDKLADLRRLCETHRLSIDRAAYIGDDWPDLTVMRAVALAIAPANAVPEIKRIAHVVTAAPGGHGAVREAIEHILRITGRHQQALRLYDPTSPSTDGQPTRPTY